MITKHALKVSKMHSLCGSPGSVAFCGHYVRTLRGFISHYAHHPRHCCPYLTRCLIPRKHNVMSANMCTILTKYRLQEEKKKSLLGIIY